VKGLASLGRKEDPLINIVRIYQHLKTEVQRGTRQNKGEHSRDNKRKMAREKDTWTIAM